MAKALSFILILSILLLTFSLSGAANTARIRRNDAERLIQSLNPFPKAADADNGRADGFLGKKSISERSFAFPGIVNGASSVEDLGHHVGYYRLPHSYDARMFYYFFESRHSKKDPVVIWLTGGPGCGSELAMFYENGPFSIANNLSLIWNDFGWDQASNLIYVDQPTGTGFSYSSDKRDIRHDESRISNDLYDFLQAFFAEHREYAKNDFYITGESYAGHYIPAFASRVHQGNKAKHGIHIYLKGFAIGNGLTDPAIQYKAYTDFALANRIIKKDDYKRINKLLPACELAIKRCGTSRDKSTCTTSYFVCMLIYNLVLKVAGNINIYDITKQCEGQLCYDFSSMEKFLNQEHVRDALGVGDIKFVPCSKTVYWAMITDWMRNLEAGIPALLEDGIKMLIYAGEKDFICNWLGNSRWVHAMKWTGHHGFVSSPETNFTVDGVKAGVLKTHGPLSFLKVHDAGHMVPMDQPKAALEMLKRWTQGKLDDSTTSTDDQKFFAFI